MESMGSEQRPDWMAYTSLGLGIVNLCSWLFPLCGVPLAIGGIVFGILGINSKQRILAIIGLALSALGLLGGIINAAFGAYLGLTGQFPGLSGFPY
jgi:hypothetical protein